MFCWENLGPGIHLEGMLTRHHLSIYADQVSCPDISERFWWFYYCGQSVTMYCMYRLYYKQYNTDSTLLDK